MAKTLVVMIATYTSTVKLIIGEESYFIVKFIDRIFFYLKIKLDY